MTTSSADLPRDLRFDGLTEAEIIAASEAGGEPAWLRDRRLAAHKRVLDQGWPDSHNDEFWRSTPFDRRIDVDRTVVVGSDAPAPASLTDGLELPAVLARIIDGRLVETTVPADLAEAGVVVMDLAEAASVHGDFVERHLGDLTTSNQEGTGAEEDRTITISDAAWTAGVFIDVPAELELDVPIVVQVHVTEPGAHLPRVLVNVGHHANAMVYFEHSSAEDVDALVDEVVEVVAGDSANVKLASLQRWGSGIQHLGLQKTSVGRDANVSHLAVTVGGKTVRLRPEFDLVGPGSSVRPLGVYFASDSQWFDLQPYIRHFAPHASSDILYKGALQGRSRTVFRGNIFVGKDAVGTNTDENNKSLILTEGARADATPFLEIECADIAAGHGSATGQIDALHLFYLESRGISRDEALRLIVYGFFREVLDEADLPGVSEAALADIEQRVEDADLSTFQVNDAALQDRS